MSKFLLLAISLVIVANAHGVVEFDELQTKINFYKSIESVVCDGDSYAKIADQKCYYVSTTRVNQTDATKLCKQLHPKGGLLAIHSAQEQQLVNTILHQKGAGSLDVWLGYEWTGKYCEYKWVDGILTNYTNWASSAWYDGDIVYSPWGSCSYLEVDISKHIFGQWMSSDCTSDKQVVCQVDLKHK
ncbi:unnamed protein product [Oppiella nova]|uniref:C-type lectin domain-containing protein n=1 Tax=Oppiella nova TaxID=334625 RepID=A0A7R9QK03_9ACAR|nr:unnamed protein product [Oppiella nova]CAG2166825.1 unnamed protein product [Oppiella nova]